MSQILRQPINVGQLERYLAEHVPEIQGPLKLSQFGFGHSNPTYCVITADNRKYVLRKRPPGELVSQTTHRVDREFKVLHALHTHTDLPVPKVVALCMDKSVVGTEFYLMEFIEGRHFEEPFFPGVDAQERHFLWRDTIQTLAKLHKIDVSAIGLADFGKVTGFYDRQIRTLSTLSISQAQVRDVETNKEIGQIPHFDVMLRYFRRQDQQPSDRASLVHGDFKIDNLLFHKTEPRVIAILDWEMSTVGHPLSDLVNLISPWYWTRETVPSPEAQLARYEGREVVNHFETEIQGLPKVDDVVNWYIEESGYTTASQELPWGIAFGGFRGAIVTQGIAARYAKRQASNFLARNISKLVEPYADWAYSLLPQPSIGKL